MLAPNRRPKEHPLMASAKDFFLTTEKVQASELMHEVCRHYEKPLTPQSCELEKPAV